VLAGDVHIPLESDHKVRVGFASNPPFRHPFPRILIDHIRRISPILLSFGIVVVL
jgi:hypothetical protein